MKTVNSGTRFIHRRELDVSKTLRATGLWISRQTDPKDGAMLGEGLLDHVLGRAERDVSNEQSVALLAPLISKGLSTRLDPVFCRCTNVGKVKVDLTPVNRSVFFRSIGFSCIFGFGEFDISKTMDARC
jgi:hypothetical protein